MNERLKREGISDVRARSAGTWAAEGALPPAHTVRVMAERGIDVRGHRAHNAAGMDVAGALLVLGMTRYHVEVLRLDFAAHAGKILLFSEMAARRFDVPDPYGSSLASYRQVANVIVTLLDQGYERFMAYLTAEDTVA